MGARAHGAQMNAWETLTVYTATCFIAYAAGLDLASLDTIALAFIGFRVLHAVLYLADLAWFRSTAYVLSMSCCLYIVYLAANN